MYFENLKVTEIKINDKLSNSKVTKGTIIFDDIPIKYNFTIFAKTLEDADIEKIKKVKKAHADFNLYDGKIYFSLIIDEI